jgi:hypothetical protein
MPKLQGIQVTKPDSTTVVDLILDELDSKRLFNTERETTSIHMVEERHVDRDSWLTALIEGVVIGR